MEVFVFVIFMLFILLAIPIGIVVTIIAVIKGTSSQAPVQQLGPDGTPIPVQRPARAPRAPRKKMSASAIMMLIGTAFIILSAVTFVAANWVKMEPSGRVFALAGAAVLSFTICAVIKAAVKLEGTSIAFYSIGSILTAVTLVTAAGYELFGSWYSLEGDGCALVYGSAFLITSIASFIAYAIYKKSGFLYAGTAFISAILMCGCIQLSESYKQFAPMIVLVQMVITAAVHVIKPQKDTVMENPVRVIGDLTAVIFGCCGLSYVVYSTASATLYTYAVLAVLMVQLVFYGIFKKQSWMFIVLNILAIYTTLILAAGFDDKYSDAFTMLFFSIIAFVIYLINAAAPKNHAASKLITFIAASIGAVMSLAADNDLYYGVNLIVPLGLSACIAGYALSKDKALQTIAGLAAPILPFASACFLSGRLTDTMTGVEYNDITTLVYGGLAVIYIAVTALLLGIPKFAFGFHAKHPMQTQTILFTNMICAAAVLVNISGYSQLFMVTAAVCILHFIVSYLLRCNITAAGSVVTLIILTSNILKHEVDDQNIVKYGLFGIFVLLIIVSRLVFSRDFITSKDGKTSIDVILLSSWITLFAIPGMDRTSAFLRLMAIAVFVVGFVKRNTNKDLAAILLSISAMFAAFAAMARPFLNPDSSMIASKVTLGIFALLGVAYKFIWKNHKLASKLVSTIIFVLSFIGLIIDGIIYEEVANRIFILAVTAGILILSFFVKSKTWFIASSTALVVITVFSTKEYFDTMGWWVYLFVVGIVLVAIAAVNEACKKKGETVKSTVTKKFSDWTW